MILLNGERADVPAGETVAGVLARVGVTAAAAGVAVAVDGEVVPRSRWGSHAIPENARVEVLTAMQGG